MSANAIRRSDDNVTEKYQKLAEKLEKVQEQLDIPKFYEYGKSVTYQKGDDTKLPTFTTNMISLSQMGKEAVYPTEDYEERWQDKGKTKAKGPYCHKCKGTGIKGTNKNGDDEYCDCKHGTIQKNRDNEPDTAKEARAIRRRVIAQLDDIMGVNEDLEIKRCPKCEGENISDLDKGLGSPLHMCEDCGFKWEDKDMIEDDELLFEGPGNDFFGEGEPLGQIKKLDFASDENSENEILASIQSMLPQITTKSNKSMNKMAGTIVSGLINSLNIEENKKLWLNAQIENGILNSDIFMRNIKTSLQNGGVK